MTLVFDAVGALRTLLQHGVRFVVIGGIAGRAWGSFPITNVLEICYERDEVNYDALTTALLFLGAALLGMGLLVLAIRPAGRKAAG